VRVALLGGGRSSEHEISRVSAEGVRGALEGEGIEVLEVTIGRDGAWTLDGAEVVLAPGPPTGRLIDTGGTSSHVDAAFPVLHGPYGEDGTIQGLCEMAGVPYVGAGVAASALAMDKSLFKLVLRDAGLPYAEYVAVEARRWADEPESVLAEVRRLGLPVFCKPARLGSSVGISRAVEEAALPDALDLALAHDEWALAEEAIVGREVEVGVLGNGADLVVSPPGEIRYEGDWYDYETKYTPGRATVEIPAELPPEVTEAVREIARRAYVALRCAGMARIDFFVREDGSVVVSELNTIPGFTPTSAYPSLMAAAGVSYGELVRRLLALATERARAAAGRRS